MQIGQLDLPFWALLRLYEGEFTFSLAQQELSQHVRGTITIRLRFYFPFWDNIKTYLPSFFTRRIKVLSAFDLPEINKEVNFHYST